MKDGIGGTDMRERYKIVRNFLRADTWPKRTIKRGLTLEEAQAHCSDPETSSRTCTSWEKRRITKQRGPWFDGYERE